MLIFGLSLLALMLLTGSFQRWDRTSKKQVALEAAIVLIVIAIVYWMVRI